MRFAERFLFILALISLGMRFAGFKDGPTMELLAFPSLALFYLVALPVNAFRNSAEIGTTRKARVSNIVLGILAGLIVAYCIISAMLYTLGWLERRDMLENTGLLLGLLILLSLLLKSKIASGILKYTLTRAGILLAGILLLSFTIPIVKLPGS
jgi:hypothetical protein